MQSHAYQQTHSAMNWIHHWWGHNICHAHDFVNTHWQWKHTHIPFDSNRIGAAKKKSNCSRWQNSCCFFFAAQKHLCGPYSCQILYISLVSSRLSLTLINDALYVRSPPFLYVAFFCSLVVFVLSNPLRITHTRRKQHLRTCQNIIQNVASNEKQKKSNSVRMCGIVFRLPVR